MQVRIKKLNENAVMPEKATELSIGYDLYVPNDICIEKERQVIPLGFAIELPPCVEAKIEPRSGFSSRGIEGFAMRDGTFNPFIIEGYCKLGDAVWQRIDKTECFNADVIVGKIDPDFRGEVGVIIRNNEPNRHFVIPKGTRIAQMTFYKTELADFTVTEKLSETERGENGYGSTGV